MTMKALELSGEMAITSKSVAERSVAARPTQRRFASKWLDFLRVALARYAARNELEWERMVEEQARDPNRY